MLDKANTDLTDPDHESATTICEKPWIDLVKCKAFPVVAQYFFTYFFSCILSLASYSSSLTTILKQLSAISLISFPIGWGSR